MRFYRRQQEAFDNRGDAEVVFCTFLHGSRAYGLCPTLDSYAEFILSDEPAAKYCNELLWSHCTTYVDLDSTVSLEELGWSSPGEFTAAFSRVLVDAFAKHLKVVVTPADLLWSCSTRPGKVSYHIKVVCNSHCWLRKDRRQMKLFFQQVDVVCQNTKGLHWWVTRDGRSTLETVLDLSVYSNNRCFRSLGCSKPDSGVPFLPLDGGLSISAIVNHAHTVKERQPFTLVDFVKCPPAKPQIPCTTWDKLAAAQGAAYVKTSGSLICLKWLPGARCPIGGEVNATDNCYFLLRDRGCTVHFGCHNACCAGKLVKVHEFASNGKYKFYNDYFEVINAKEPDLKMIQDYLIGAISYIDRSQEPFFVTRERTSLEAFDHKLTLPLVNCSKSLFKGYADIKLFIDEKPVRFSGVLKNLLESRRVRTYIDSVWYPHQASEVVQLPANKYNTFPGFALEQVPPSDVSFPSTAIYELLKRMAGPEPSFTYLKCFLAAKLKRPFVKHPVALCFINSKEGTGKGSLSLFLELLFSCGRSTVVSFNTLEGFCNHFNVVQSRAMFVVLEEVTAKLGGLKQFNGLLKDKISATSIMCEPKGKERVQLPWFANLVIFSNEFNVLSVSRNDRRLVMFESDSSKANDTKFFKRVYAELADVKILRAAWDWFNAVDLSKWNYRELPSSKLKRDLCKLSRPNVVKFYEWFFSTRGAQTLSVPELYEAYGEYCYTCGAKNKMSRDSLITQLGMYLGFMVPENGLVTFTETQRVSHQE